MVTFSKTQNNVTTAAFAVWSLQCHCGVTTMSLQRHYKASETASSTRSRIPTPDRAIGPSCFRPRHVFFFDLQLFFRAQSFSQPLCIILSSLFLGPKHLVANPGSFFEPRDIFSGPPASAGETHTKSKHAFLHTQQGKSHTKSALGVKSDENKLNRSHTQGTNKNKHHNEEKATRNRFRV